MSEPDPAAVPGSWFLFLRKSRSRPPRAVYLHGKAFGWPSIRRTACRHGCHFLLSTPEIQKERRLEMPLAHPFSCRRRCIHYKHFNFRLPVSPLQKSKPWPQPRPDSDSESIFFRPSPPSEPDNCNQSKLIIYVLRCTPPFFSHLAYILVPFKPFMSGTMSSGAVRTLHPVHPDHSVHSAVCLDGRRQKARVK